MLRPDSRGLTQLLCAARAGDRAALERAGPQIYEMIRAIAAKYGRRRPPDASLETTDIVHDVFLRLFASKETKPWAHRDHFAAVAARALRSVLVDHARRRKRLKRAAPGTRVALDDIVAQYERRSGDLEVVDDALTKLAEVDPALSRIVELKFFAGLSLPEIEQLEDVPLRTLERRLQFARAWLRRELRRES